MHNQAERFYIFISCTSFLCATHLGGESVVIDTMLGTMTIIQSIVNVYLFELIVIGERTTRYIDSYLRLPVCSKHQELPSIV